MLFQRALVSLLLAGSFLAALPAQAQTATMRVVKACPTPDAWRFDFQLWGGPSGDLWDFDLPCDGVTEWVKDVEPGNWSLREKTLPTGWVLEWADCEDMQTGTKTTNLLDMTIEPGKEYLCTFKNTKKAKMRVIKQCPTPDLWPFEFKLWGGPSSDQWDFDLPCDGVTEWVKDVEPGMWSLKEKNLPPGWFLEWAGCKDMQSGAVTTNLVDMLIEPGKEFLCTFKNEKSPPVPAVGLGGLLVTVLGLGAGSALALRHRRSG